MPELPEVETTRKGIELFLKDHSVLAINIHNSRLRWPIPSSLNNLCRKKITHVRRRGKYLLIGCRSGTAIIHLGMSGSLRICETNSIRRKHDHVEFILANKHVLRFNDPRRFGCVLWWEDDIFTHPLLSKLGPEPLGTDFDFEHLVTAAKNRKTAVKNLLMDNHVVVGVGNIYASESLFHAGIRPGRAAGRVSREQYKRLTIAIKQVLTAAIKQGGTTLKDFVNSDGNPGYFAQSLQVYGRKSQACYICQSLIKMKTIGQRASYYCPVCQKY